MMISQVFGAAKSVGLCFAPSTAMRFGFVAVFAASIATTCPGERPVKLKKDLQQQLREDVEFLAGEDLRGRSAADETIHEAAKYVGQRMASIGLKVDVVDDGPFQDVDVTLGAQVGNAENNYATFELALEKNDGEKSVSEENDDDENNAKENSDTDAASDSKIVAELSKGMNPLTIGSQKGSASGKVVFAGYGITSRKLNYDDYAGVDVKDAIVIILRKEPGGSDPNSPFDGVKNTRHAYFATKAENAIKHGAAGVMIVNDEASIKEAVRLIQYRIKQEQTRAERLEKQLKELPEEAVNSRTKFQMQLQQVKASAESMALEQKQIERGVLGISGAGGRVDGKTRIPMVSVARDVVDRLLKSSGQPALKEVEESINQRFRPQSMELAGVTGSISVELKPSVATSPNVIGVIPGRGALKNETVVVGAHYDHVGMGGYGSLAPGTVAIHNGADDNASGTATILGAAELLMKSTESYESHRRIVFIAFTGEERGLIGSKYYVANPLYPLETTAAMINLDMVGRLRDNELTLYGTGSAEEMDEIVEVSNEKHAFSLFKIPTGYGPSDHQSFYKAGVPVLFFFTGLHNDYHRPSDDFDKIDFGSMTRITDMVSDVTLQLAVRKERPKYAETEKRVEIRRQLTAYLGAQIVKRGDQLVVSEVSKDSPASKSGLLANDQLSRFNKRRVRTVQDVKDLLRLRSPGDELQVQVIRNGQTVDLQVKLGKRPTG